MTLSHVKVTGCYFGDGYTDISFRDVIGSYTEGTVGSVVSFNYFRCNCFTHNLGSSSIVMASLWGYCHVDLNVRMMNEVSNMATFRHKCSRLEPHSRWQYCIQYGYTQSKNHIICYFRLPPVRERWSYMFG